MMTCVPRGPTFAMTVAPPKMSPLEEEIVMGPIMGRRRTRTPINIGRPWRPRRLLRSLTRRIVATPHGDARRELVHRSIDPFVHPKKEGLKVKRRALGARNVRVNRRGRRQIDTEDTYNKFQAPLQSHEFHGDKRKDLCQHETEAE